MFGIGRLGRWSRVWGLSVAPLPTIGADDEGKVLTVVSGVEAWRDIVNMGAMAWVYEDFLCGSPLPPLSGANSGSGSLNAMRGAAGSAAHPGAWRLGTGTTTTGYANLFGSAADDLLKFGGGATTFETIIKLSALSDGTDTYTCLTGITTPAYGNTLSITNGIYFRYTHSASSGNWELRCANASSTTTRDTGIAAIAGWVRLGFVINAAGTSVQAYVNGTAAGAPITTNIPATTTAMMQQWFILKSAGTTAVLCDIDAYKISVVLGTSR